MNRQAKNIIAWGIGAIVVVGILFLMASPRILPNKLDSFAQCLTDKGVVYYGAFWCPNCQAQNRLFGSSKRLIKYVECSTADGRGQVPECTENDIKGYPTFEFADGSRVEGRQSLESLAEKSGCQLPR